MKVNASRKLHVTVIRDNIEKRGIVSSAYKNVPYKKYNSETTIKSEYFKKKLMVYYTSAL